MECTKKNIVDGGQYHHESLAALKGNIHDCYKHNPGSHSKWCSLEKVLDWKIILPGCKSIYCYDGINMLTWLAGFPYFISERWLYWWKRVDFSLSFKSWTSSPEMLFFMLSAQLNTLSPKSKIYGSFCCNTKASVLLMVSRPIFQLCN